MQVERTPEGKSALALVLTELSRAGQQIAKAGAGRGREVHSWASRSRQGIQLPTSPLLTLEEPLPLLGMQQTQRPERLGEVQMGAERMV